MSRFVLLTGLALRELWISFRLLLVVGALLLAILPAVLLPHVMSPDLAGAPPDPLTWLSIALAGALALAAGVSAATLAAERRRGTAGWMTARAVPRTSIAISWFVAFGLLVVLGTAAGTAVAWLSLEPVLGGGPQPLVAGMLAAGCVGLAAVTLGLLLGAWLPAWPAAVLSAVPVGALLLAVATGLVPPGTWWAVPADGLRVLAALDTAARPVADGLRASGAALGLAAGLLVLALVAFERADL